MTLEELKQRILSTGYLPEWLKDSVDLMGGSVPPVVFPATAPPQPVTKKWCPFARVRLVQAAGGTAFNRVLRATEAGLPSEITTAGSFCIQEACAMWTGSDCGLKAGNKDMIAFMEAQVDEMVAKIDPPVTDAGS